MSNSIVFLSEEHSEMYYDFLSNMKRNDSYHRSLAYLLTLDTACSSHISDLFDIESDCIILSGFSHGWQTGTSRKTTRLAYNLWNGFCYDSEKTYVDEEGCTCQLPCPYFAVDEIFCCSYAPYYWEAIKLRYPEYANSNQ